MVFPEKGVLKICSKFTGEDPCRRAILIKLHNNFIEIVLRHGCSPVNLLHIFRTPFSGSTTGWLLLKYMNHGKKTVARKAFKQQFTERIKRKHERKKY